MVAESAKSMSNAAVTNRAITLALMALVAGGAASCRRSRGLSTAPNASLTPLDARDVRCVERPEGCVPGLAEGSANRESGRRKGFGKLRGAESV